MGFDVVYITPIHPIGRTNRKGKNNSLTPLPTDPGSPYAIGNELGGHDAIEPSLGTIKDFDHFQEAVRAQGMEIAMDFAINCSPDHPYVKAHPEWFAHRPDGTIKYAENPPKKYQDIYNVDFYCEDWRGLWNEMKRVILFWADHGVKIFRVDNPHTKPVAFWAWLIGEVQGKYPDAIFLSEAFTKPKMMKALAKAGFTQSYTYFTWRNFKQELTEYLVELSRSEMGQMKMAWFPMTKGAPGAAGALVKGEGYMPSHAGTLVYLHVKDIDETMARIRTHGGRVLLPKSRMGEYGFVAHFEDTEGNRVALHSNS